MLKDSTNVKRLTKLFSEEVYCFPSAFSGNDKRPRGEGATNKREKKKKAFSLILMQRQTQTYEHNLTLLGKHI